ncbi:MAG: GAF domain-containing protein, partial [Acidobacteriota bacterium]
IVDDYRNWPYRSPRYERMPFTAALQVPMLYGGELIGVLCVNEIEETVRKFSQTDARLLSLFAGQAASAVHNARLFHETRIRAEQLALLYDAGLTLNRVLEQRTQLEFLFKIAIKALHAERATFYRYSPEQNQIFAEQGVGYTPELEQRLRQVRFDVGTSEHLVARVARERVPIVLPDIRAEPTWVPVDPTIRSGAWAPIQHENRLRGVLSVLSTRYNAFSPQDERLLVLFANQVSVAMENAELFEETRHRADQLTVLNRIARAVNGAAGLDELLQVIHREITATVPADAFFIALYDAEANLLDYRVRVDEGLVLPPERRTLTEGLSSRVVQTRQPLLIRDWEQEQGDLPPPALWGSMKRPRAWLGVPMQIGETVVGIINVQSYSANVYDDEDRQLLTTIADQVAVVIEKARLFEAEKTRRGELASLYDLSRALADASDFDSILALVVRHAVQSLHVTLARTILLDGDHFVLRAAYPSYIAGEIIKIGRMERADAHPYYLRVLEQNEPIVLHPGDPQVGPSEQQELFMHAARDVCLVPLRTGQRAFGLLILGQPRNKGEDNFTSERMRLAHSIADQTASALSRAELFSELESAYLQSVLSLANAVDAKDTYTANHSERLAEMALAVGRELDMSPRALEDLRFGSLLHDIGKIGVPDAILQKPDPLTAEEWKEMRRHSEMGEQIIKPIPRLAGAAGIVRHHHERYDGLGYPDGLVGGAIPLGARILAVVDAYSAIVDKRVYKQAQSHEDAITELASHIGTQFDPRVMEAFFKIYK